MSPEKIVIHILNVLSLPEPERKRRATNLLTRFQKELARNPYTTETKNLHKALLEMYSYLGCLAQQEGKVDGAMHWFTESLGIATRSEENRREFSEIFLYLGHFYLSLSKYAVAAYYVRLYKRYNPAVGDFCDDVIQSMMKVRTLSERLADQEQ